MSFFDKILSRFLPNRVWKNYLYKKEYGRLSKSTLGSLLKNNLQFKDIHKGRRCFLLGNGPSLKNIDLAWLEDEITFTVNDLFYKEDFDKINTTYHVFADPAYYYDFNNTLEQLLSKASPKRIFMEGSGFGKLKKSEQNGNAPISFFINGIEVDDLYFTPIDLCRMLPYYSTVVQSALMIAAYMGFKEIYLLGCDCTGILNYIDKVHGRAIRHYAYELPGGKPKPHTYIANSEQIFFEWYHIFKSYRIINDIFKANNIRLVDLTENGIIDSLEKGKLCDVIRSK